MCARRFLIIVLVLTLIAVAGAFAMFQFGGEVLLKSATPKGHYVAPPIGDPGPDYTDPGNWVAHPGKARDPSRWLPKGFPADKGDGEAAVFYIHPTTYLQRDQWNAPLLPDKESEFRTRLFTQSQASAFNDVGDIWAPRYRQAAYGAFLLDSKDARAALDLAYADVASAFDRFIAESGDRPIILAGHSQGSLHLMRLLKERLADKAIAKRVVAAYVVGWPISRTADVPALGLRACQTAEDSRCILSWMSFAAPANADLVLKNYEGGAGFDGKTRKREDMLCVDPISGTLDGSAPPADNPGTLVPTANLLSARLAAQQVGAHCDKGLLMIDGAVPALGPYVLPGNNYHVYDYALFWGAVRRDAARRLAAWTP